MRDLMRGPIRVVKRPCAHRALLHTAAPSRVSVHQCGSASPPHLNTTATRTTTRGAAPSAHQKFPHHTGSHVLVPFCRLCVRVRAAAQS